MHGRGCRSLFPNNLRGARAVTEACTKIQVSTVRVIKGGWVDRKSIPRGPNGRGLCRWCSLEVPRGRFTFCSPYCVHEWKLRTQPGYLREQVFERDRGDLRGLRCGHGPRGAAASLFAYGQAGRAAGALGPEAPHAQEPLGCRSHPACGRRRRRVRSRQHPHAVPAMPLRCHHGTSPAHAPDARPIIATKRGDGFCPMC